MRIAFLGNFHPPASTEMDLLKSMHLLGHDVSCVQESTATRGELDAAVGGADVFWHCHSHGWLPPIDREWLDSLPIPSIGFTLDLFRGLRRHSETYVQDYPWFRSAWFMSPDEPDHLRALGVNAYFSPPAILATSCYAAVPLDERLDIVFVGSVDSYHPEHAWRLEMIRFLRDRYGSRFVTYDHSSGLREHRLNRVYATARVVAGDSCLASPASRYCSDRVYETLGRGGNLVHPRFDDAGQCLGLRDLGTWYESGNVDSLAASIDEAMERPELSSRDMRERRCARIRAADTYTHRVDAILRQVMA